MHNDELDLMVVGLDFILTLEVDVNDVSKETTVVLNAEEISFTKLDKWYIVGFMLARVCYFSNS